MRRSILLFTALLSACARIDTVGWDEPDGDPIPVTRLRSEPYSFAHYSSLGDSARIVVRDREAWSALWIRMNANTTSRTLPEVDFEREMLVVAALGTRPSGGFSILVDGAYQAPDHVEVVIRKTSSGSQCLTTQALTQPVDIARLPRSSQPVVFIERSAVHQC